MQITKRNNLGLSLIELLMTLAVLATLISVAAPAFGKLITARILAASKNVHVVVCPSADQEYCGHTTEWQHGWLVFIDADDDGLRDADEDLLSVAQAQPNGVAIVSTVGRTRIDYRPDGSATGSNVTFTVCDRRGSDDATALVINNAGRVRSGKPTAGAAAACEQVLDKPQA